MTRDWTPYSILIVEDNQGDFLLLEEYLLEQMGKLTVFHARSFNEALEIIAREKENIDAILLDLSLPDVTKEDLLKACIPLGEVTPIIILTGYNDLDFAVKSLGLGFADYLVKDTISAALMYKAFRYAIERFAFVLRVNQSRKRYTELFQSSPEPMWVIDTKTHDVIDVNHAALMQYGYRRDEFLALPFHQLFNVEEQEILKSIIDNGAVGISKTDATPAVFKHLRKDQSDLWVEVSVNQMEFDGRDTLIVLAKDITRLINQQESIDAQNKRLREIAWEQSHIVRAPVVRIMGIVELLNSDVVTEEERAKLLNGILSSAKELDKITRDIVNKTYDEGDIAQPKLR